MSKLLELAARLERAGADEQWGLLREAGRVALDGDVGRRLRLNTLCDAGGFRDAAELLLPDGISSTVVEDYRSVGVKSRAYAYPKDPAFGVSFYGCAATPGMALAAAGLRANATMAGEAGRRCLSA